MTKKPASEQPASWRAFTKPRRRLESLESEHRPDSLLYPAMISGSDAVGETGQRTEV
jgi:hypothetical protein